MLQKLQCLKILIGTIKISRPLSRLSSKIQIQHRIYIIHPKSVHMKFIQPEKRIGNKKIFDHRTSVIIKHGAPHRMNGHSRILYFIKRSSVKFLKPCIKPRKLSRCPVQDHANPCLMKILHQCPEICRSPKTGSHSIIRRRRISS